MKATLRASYNNKKDFLLDLEAENKKEILFIKLVKEQGLMPVHLQREDAETLVLPSRDNKIQFNIQQETINEIVKVFKSATEKVK